MTICDADLEEILRWVACEKRREGPKESGTEG
jgi:hypothetical protein